MEEFSQSEAAVLLVCVFFALLIAKRRLEKHYVPKRLYQSLPRPPVLTVEEWNRENERVEYEIFTELKQDIHQHPYDFSTGIKNLVFDVLRTSSYLPPEKSEEIKQKILFRVSLEPIDPDDSRLIGYRVGHPNGKSSLDQFERTES